LVEAALSSCNDMSIAGSAIVGSAGLTTGAEASGLGDVLANGNLVLDGSSLEVDGNAMAGAQVITNGQPVVTGTIGTLAEPIDCSVVDLATLYAGLDSENDNDLVPLTQRGRDPLSGRDLEVKANDVLTLPAGTYLFSSIKLSGRAEIALEGPVRLLVAGDVALAGKTLINQLGSPYDLRIWSTGSIAIEGQAVVRALIWAANGELRLNGAAELYGSALAGTIDVNGAEVTRIVDDLAPQLAIDSPAAGETVDACEILVSGSLNEVETGATLTINGQAIDVRTDGSFTTLVSLWTEPPGMIVAEAIDGGGNTTTVSVQVVIAAPVVDLSVPAPESLVGTRLTDLSGNAGTATTVTVNGTPAVVSNGQWQLTGYDLGDDGISPLEIIGSNCGDSTTYPTHLDLDTLAPEIEIDPATSTITGSPTIVIGGTVQDAHLAGVEVNGVPAAVDGDHFSATIPLANEGANDVTATAFDELDRTATSTIEVILDTTLPSVNIDSPAAGLVTDATEIVVSCTASDSNLAGVEVNGISAVPDGESFLATVTLDEEGSNQITAVATDQAGNPSPPTTISVVRDTLAPVITDRGDRGDGLGYGQRPPPR
jgi:hypothetical protein